MGKHGSIRHYFQHFLVGLAFYFVAIVIAGKGTLLTFLLFFFFTYIIDVEVLFATFGSDYTEEVKAQLNRHQFRKAAITATKNHKKLNHLFLHNIFGLLLLLSLTTVFLKNSNIIGFYACMAVLGHFSFDIFDDFYQLGHINNWLWPIRSLQKLFK